MGQKKCKAMAIENTTDYNLTCSMQKLCAGHLFKSSALGLLM